MLDQPQAAELIRHVHHMVQAAKVGRLAPMDIEHLCNFSPLASGSFRGAGRVSDADAIAMWMDHNPQSNPPVENPRIVDALFFAATLLLCLPAARINVESTRANRKLYYYLRYEHPTDLSEDMRIRFGRIIIDAPDDRAVAFIGDHHDYRLANLTLRAPIPNMQEPKLGREAAIRLAQRLFCENAPGDLSYLSVEGYEALLRDTLETATAYHGKQEG